jgi:hypothetical protein
MFNVNRRYQANRVARNLIRENDGSHYERERVSDTDNGKALYNRGSP